MPVTAATVGRANELGAELYRHEDLSFDPGRADAMAELAAHPEFGGAWLIEADGRTAGYVVLAICYELELHGRYGVLDEFYLDESYRGRGIGTRTLAFIDEQCRARGLKAARLQVGHTNLRARGLYERSGYRVEERHLMTKWL